MDKNCSTCRYSFFRENALDVCVEEYMKGKPGTEYSIAKALPKERICDKWEQKQ